MRSLGNIRSDGKTLREGGARVLGASIIRRATGRVRSSLLACFLLSLCFMILVSCFEYLVSCRARGRPLRADLQREVARSRRRLLQAGPWTDFSDFWSHWRGIKKTCFFNMGQNRPESCHNRILSAQGSIFGRFSWILGAISASIFQHFPE